MRRDGRYQKSGFFQSLREVWRTPQTPQSKMVLAGLVAVGIILTVQTFVGHPVRVEQIAMILVLVGVTVAMFDAFLVSERKREDEKADSAARIDVLTDELKHLRLHAVPPILTVAHRSADKEREELLAIALIIMDRKTDGLNIKGHAQRECQLIHSAIDVLGDDSSHILINCDPEVIRLYVDREDLGRRTHLDSIQTKLLQLALEQTRKAG